MKIRKPKTTFMVTAMVLSVAFLLVSCGIDTTRQEQTVPDVTEETKINENMTNESDVTDNHEVLNEKIDIYNRVLAEYSDMVQNDFYMELRDSDAYDNSFGEHIGLEIRTHKRMRNQPLRFRLGIMTYMVMMEPMWFLFSQKWNLDTEQISLFTKMEL